MNESTYSLYQVVAWNPATGRVYELDFGAGISPNALAATSDKEVELRAVKALPDDADLSNVKMSISKYAPSY